MPVSPLPSLGLCVYMLPACLPHTLTLFPYCLFSRSLGQISLLPHTSPQGSGSPLGLQPEEGKLGKET